MSTPSLADQAVQALAMVSAMDAHITNAHAERHAVRTLKRLAEQRISDALRDAMSLAYLAQDAGVLAAERQREQP